MSPREYQNEFARNGRQYGQSGKIDLAQIWLERASEIRPLTNMQLWKLKQTMGDINFQKLNFNLIQVGSKDYLEEIL